jgi:YVTN family beta-propeller protein
MLKPRLLLFALVVVVSIGFGQWLEKVMYLPDSAGGVLSPQTVACNPVGTRVYVGGTSRGVSVLDAASGQRLYRIETGPDVSAVLYVPIRNKVYVASRGVDTVYVADGATGRVSGAIPVGRGPAALAGLPSGERLYVACAGTSSTPDSRVYEIDCSTDAVRAIHVVGSHPIALSYDPANNFLYSTNSMSNTVSAIDCSSGIDTIEIPVGSGPAALACNPGNNKVYCANADDSTVSIIDGSSNQVRATVVTGRRPRAVCYDSAENTVFCANGFGRTISVIDGASDQVTATIPLSRGPLKLDLDVDSNRIYCITGNHVVTIDAQSNQVVDSLFLGAGLSAVCFARQSRRLLAANTDLSAVALIDVDSNRLQGWTRVGIEPDMLLADQSGTRLYAFGGVYPYDSVNVSAIDPQRCIVTTCFEIQSDGHPRSGCHDSADDKVYLAGPAAKVGIIDAEGDSVLGYVSVPDAVFDLAYAPAFDKVYVGGGYDSGFIAAIDGRGDTLVASLPITGGGGIVSICHDPTRGAIYGFGNKRADCAWVDCQADTIVLQFASGAASGGSLYNPISDKLYNLDRGFGEMVVIDAATHTIVAELPIGNGAGEITLNTVNNKVYNTGLYELDVVDGAGDSLVARLSFSPYHRYLAYDPDDNIVYFDHDSGDVNAIEFLDGATDSVVGNILVPGDLSDMIAVPQADRVFVADNNNSCLYVIGTGHTTVIEGPLSGAHRAAREATVVNGVLFLPEADGSKTQATALLDISGRKVMDMQAGANDVRALTPGVYFIREAGAQAPAQAVRRVVITK